MKLGDKYDVTIAGQVVAQAEVRELADGTATLVVPGTKVVMATKTDIAPETVNVDGTGTATIIDGVDRPTSEGVDNGEVLETPPAPVAVEEPAPVVENPAPQPQDGMDTPVQTEVNSEQSEG